MGEKVRAGDIEIYVEQVGEGPDVLLLGGLTTPSSHGSRTRHAFRPVPVDRL